MSTASRIIVFAQDPDIDVPANCPSHTEIALADGTSLTIVATNGVRKPRRLVMPAARFDLAQVVEARATGDWMDLRVEICGSDNAEVYVICAFDHPLKEVLLLWSISQRFRFAIYFSKVPARLSVNDYSLLGSAANTLFATPEIEAGVRTKYIGPLRSIDSPDKAETKTENTQAPYLSGSRPDQKKLLLVSYHSGPSRTVGVQRPNYWFEAIEDITDGRYCIHLATATRWDQLKQNLHYVPDLHAASLAEPYGVFPDWAPAFVKAEQMNARTFNTLSHYWQVALENYFDHTDLSFDAVVMTGNPFSFFDFARYAKEKWYARTVLDYRDPFANNPRMKFTSEARERARYIEKGFNLQADLAIVVNEDCRALLVAADEIATAIIPNGFDDRVPIQANSPNEQDGTIKLVHAGQFRSDCPPNALLDAIQPGHHSFHHIGTIDARLADVLVSDKVVAHGHKPYAETLGLIASADCGIVFITEDAFETPTKVFDYLAAGIDILVCTAGEKHAGALADLLKGRDGIYWSHNTPVDLRRFLASYTPTRDRTRLHEQGARFSRRHSTEQLIKRIDRLLSPAFKISAE